MAIVRMSNINNRHILSALAILAFLLLYSVVPTCFSQECVATQYRTDDGRLVDVPKGEMKKLLINGVWCECWGCGDCIPISDTRTQAVVNSRVLSLKRQELTDEQMIEMLERTKELMAPVRNQDEARRQAEARAFHDRLSLLARELKSLETESLTQYRGLKLKLQDLAARASTIKEIGNIAGWSLKAAQTSFAEVAREKAGWGFDDWAEKEGYFDINSVVPEVPVPESQTPQFKAFKYIADWAGDMYTKLLRISERRREVYEQGEKIQTEATIVKLTWISPLASNYAEEDKKRKEKAADLEKQAEALLKEAQQLYEQAREYEQEVSNMQREFFALAKDPSRADGFLARHSGDR